MALRIVTVKALTGKTFAGSRVFDSAIAPLDMQIEEKRAPIITVYTDEEDASVTGKDMLGADNALSLVIHCAVASCVKTETGDDVVEIPHTDEGLEMTMDLMRHDILVALQTDIDPWCELWRQLVINCKSLAMRRGAGSNKGLRFAARELTFHLETVAEPFREMGQNSLFAEIVATLRSSGDLAGVADLIEQRTLATTEIKPWEMIAKTLGLPRRAALVVWDGGDFGTAPITEVVVKPL